MITKNESLLLAAILIFIIIQMWNSYDIAILQTKVNKLIEQHNIKHHHINSPDKEEKNKSKSTPHTNHNKKMIGYVDRYVFLPAIDIAHDISMHVYKTLHKDMCRQCSDGAFNVKTCL